MVSTTAKRFICSGSAAVLAFSTLLAIGVDDRQLPALGTWLIPLTQVSPYVVGDVR